MRIAQSLNLLSVATRVSAESTVEHGMSKVCPTNSLKFKVFGTLRAFLTLAMRVSVRKAFDQNKVEGRNVCVRY
ncbi:MAG: hypothetical protein C0483_09535 [Pirellula sp.]|nr:hypothetical protein [Pirellula sp.]